MSPLEGVMGLEIRRFQPSRRTDEKNFERDVCLPVVDAFRTFCIDPDPEGAALLLEVQKISSLSYTQQNQTFMGSPGDLR